MIFDSEFEKVIKTYPVIKSYLAGLPKELWSLLLPNDVNNWAEFAGSLAVLSRNEEERTYVMNLQRKYNLPLRPGDSVKRTMIMARIKHLKKRAKLRNRHQSGYRGNLPIDPLE